MSSPLASCGSKRSSDTKAKLSIAGSNSLHILDLMLSAS
jgi:hypothetical protein